MLLLPIKRDFWYKNYPRLPFAVKNYLYATFHLNQFSSLTANRLHRLYVSRTREI